MKAYQPRRRFGEGSTRPASRRAGSRRRPDAQAASWQRRQLRPRLRGAASPRVMRPDADEHVRDSAAQGARADRDPARRPCRRARPPHAARAIATGGDWRRARRESPARADGAPRSSTMTAASPTAASVAASPANARNTRIRNRHGALSPSTTARIIVAPDTWACGSISRAAARTPSTTAGRSAVGPDHQGLRPCCPTASPAGTSRAARRSDRDSARPRRLRRRSAMAGATLAAQCGTTARSGAGRSDRGPATAGGRRSH